MQNTRNLSQNEMRGRLKLKDKVDLKNGNKRRKEVNNRIRQ